MEKLQERLRYNNDLKELVELCGIETRLTSLCLQKQLAPLLRNSHIASLVRLKFI
ncbi:hypothetical protein DSM04_101598 [Leeuwenhoekiella aestuarii]|uniref:Uncharacterized protein n=1 Tax=Leeuwenhoekiella aestuarii TaxID=2249426 RepID=A0A4Q0P0K5_9FLAO|nr:hypothetical protein DSM04_101598 [Leeuwenhoekiella aestuarii]